MTGIIGLGVGQACMEGYNAHPDCEVTALCDLSEEKLDLAKKIHWVEVNIQCK